MRIDDDESSLRRAPKTSVNIFDGGSLSGEETFDFVHTPIW